MQGKRPFYLILTLLVVLNLVATNLQAQAVQRVYKAHAETGTPITFQFTSSH